MDESIVKLAEVGVARIFPSGPRVRCYYASESAERARAALVRCIERMEGPALLVGPSGAGKSLILGVLAESFRYRLSVANLPGGQLRTARELHQGILYALGLPFRGLDEGELRLSLLQRLEADEADPGMLLLVDEVQSLSIELMEELRMLTNIVHDGTSRVQLVLAGTPSLEEQLADVRLASLHQRIAVRCYLGELTRAETRSYIQAHLLAAGQDADLFTADAADRVYDVSEGLPRLVNQVCDHALLLARAEGIESIDGSLVDEAWSDLQQLPSRGAFAAPQQTDADADELIEFAALEASEDDSMRRFSIVRGEPSDRIDAIQEQLAAINLGADSAIVQDKYEHGEYEMGEEGVDFSLPDDEWPEVEVVVRQSPAAFGEEFHEEEVVEDPFVGASTRFVGGWTLSHKTAPAGRRDSAEQLASTGDWHAHEPLHSVPLMIHVETELFSPDPVLPDEQERLHEQVLAATPAATPGEDAPEPAWRPRLVDEQPPEGAEVAQPTSVRPLSRTRSAKPAKRKFATLFSSLQG